MFERLGRTTPDHHPGHQGRAPLAGLDPRGCRPPAPQRSQRPPTTDGRRIGAIKVYSPAPFTFDDRSVFLIEKLTEPAAVLLANVRDREATQRVSAQLVHALAERDTIARAQGIMSERRKLTSRAALDLLLRASRGENKRLHDIAMDIIHSTTKE